MKKINVQKSSGGFECRVEKKRGHQLAKEREVVRGH